MDIAPDARMRALILLSTLLLPLFSSCADTEYYEVSSDKLDTLGSRIAIQSFRRGTWLGDRVCYSNGDRTISQNVWVDISVYSLGPEKTVSMVWTDDDWQTTHEADAWYEGNVGGNYETWGVDLAPVGVLEHRSFGVFWDRTHSPKELTTSCVDDCKKTIEYSLRYVDHATGNVYVDDNSRDDGVAKNYTIVIDNTDARNALEQACEK